MATRKVTVTLTRTYSKEAIIELDVDENIKDEELQDFLTENEEINSRLENELSEASLDGGDDTYEYSDPMNYDGGHL